MWQLLGALVDTIHALALAVWVVGIPLLFWSRWPRLSRIYSIFALVFIFLYQGSRWLLGECFLTTLARLCWQRGTPVGGAAPSDDWFTVRMAEAVFQISPSHRSIVILAQLLVCVVAAGVLFTTSSSRAKGAVVDDDGQLANDERCV